MKRDIYSEVTAKILAELQTGSAPWVKPWSSTPGRNMPGNAVTGRPYSGCNVILLWLTRSAGWNAPRFLTFKQAIDAGGHVRKGEKGTTVFFVKKLHVRDTSEPDSSDDARRVIPMMRSYTVFNIEQCDGLPDKITKPEPLKPRNADARHELADAFIKTTGADFREGAGEAYFAPGADFISMPAFEAFKSASIFYAVGFHELGHWTGHKSRLDRDLRGRFGDKHYAAEELVAELTAAFLCAEFDIDGDLRHAAYIESWIKMLRDDSRAFFTAASKAQAAADYLRGKALADEVADEQEAA